MSEVGSGTGKAQGSGRTVGLGCLALFIVASVSAVFGFFQMTALPPLEADNRPLPDPNGFDAVKAVVQRLTPNVKDSPLLSRTASAGALRRALEPDLEDLEVLSDALKLPYMTPPVTPAGAMADPTNGMGGAVREGARKLVARSRLLAAEGRHDEAMASALDAIALGIKVGRGGTMVDALVGNACVYLGHSEANRLIEPLDAGSLRRHRDRLESLLPEAADEEDVLKVERRLSRLLSRQLGGNPMSRLVEYQTDRVYKEALEETAKPSTQRQATSAATSPYGAVLAKVIPDMRKSLEKRDRLLAVMRLKMAVEEYRKARGRVPASVDDLIPEVISQPVIDPPTGQPLRYRRIGASYDISPPQASTRGF